MSECEEVIFNFEEDSKDTVMFVAGREEGKGCNCRELLVELAATSVGDLGYGDWGIAESASGDDIRNERRRKQRRR